jgi:hypothetical protein
LTDPLVITGVFILGAAAGSLVTHLRDRTIMNRETQGAEFQEAALNRYSPAVIDLTSESITYGEGYASNGCSPDFVGISSQGANNADIGIGDSDFACYGVGESRSGTVRASRGQGR